MNTDKIDIQRLRVLLDKFYDGTATQSEITLLYDFFNNANDDEIPVDFAIDAELFRAMSDNRQQIKNNVPETLERRLLDFISMTEQNCKPARKQSVFISYSRWIAPIAAAIILAVLFIRHDRPSETQQTVNSSLVAKAEKSSTDTTERNLPMLKQNDIAHINSDTQQPIARTIHKNEPKTDSTSCYYREIDDPEEAEKLVSETLAIIGNKIAIANNSMSKTSSKINNLNSTLKNILNDEKF